MQAGGDVAADRRVGQVELEDAHGPLASAGAERQVQLDRRRPSVAGVVGVRVEVGQGRDDLAVRGLERLVVILVRAQARAVGGEPTTSPSRLRIRSRRTSPPWMTVVATRRRSRICAHAQPTTLDRTAVERRLDRGMRDQRSLRATLGQPASLRLAAQADGEHEAEHEHRHEADRGIQRERPSGRPWVAGRGGHTRAFGSPPTHLDDHPPAWTKEVLTWRNAPKSGG